MEQGILVLSPNSTINIGKELCGVTPSGVTLAKSFDPLQTCLLFSKMKELDSKVSKSYNPQQSLILLLSSLGL